MADLKPYTGPPKLVLAFDIGATFSGVSYCILEPGQVPEILGVRMFAGWGLVCGDAKAPSLLYYDKSGNFKAAGAEVLSERMTEVALIEEWTKAEWWKLRLCPKHLASSISTENDLPPLPPGKSAVDVVTDFIRYLFWCAKTYIQERHSKSIWSSIEDSIEYVFTLPNGWEAVRHVYRQAAEHAGLIPITPEGQSRVHIQTEGEATIQFCVSNLLGAESADQASPRGIVIIDAGGGTIDLSMFSMTSNPLSCEEIAPAECRLQGSVFVTRRAKALLQRKLEGWEHSSREDIAKYTSEFDRSTKLVIKSDQEPAYVRVAGRRVKNEKYDIAYGKLRLSGEEATGLFNDSIDAIISAFEQQQKSAMMPITTALLVGGLSTNDWVWAQLQLYFKARNIDICRPDNHINKAVTNGAVISHIRNGLKMGVKVNRQALIDKVLARYSEEFTLFRELLKNTDDVGSSIVEIHFETAAYQGCTKGENTHPLLKLTDVEVIQWTYKHDGKLFDREAWDQLSRIAEGNPIPGKVGTFGIDFYSLFSVTESPCVKSGGYGIDFSWGDNDNQLYVHLRDLSHEELDPWTTFEMPLREPAPIPPLLDFMQFLTSSITFMVNLRTVGVFLDGHHLGRVEKSPETPRTINVPTEMKQSRPSIMHVKEVRRHRIMIKAEVMNAAYTCSAVTNSSSMELNKSRVDLTLFTAEVDVKLDKKFSAGLEESEFRSSLNALQAEMAEATERWTPGIGAFKRWMSQNSLNIDTPALIDDSSSFSSDKYNVFAYNALLGTRSGSWSLAYENAKQSIDIRPSAMGYITRALAKIGMGELEEAMGAFDLIFRNCDPDESKLLLLIKSVTLFMAGRYDNAISRMHDLIAVSRYDETCYCYAQVLGKMYLMRGDYERAVQSLERGQDLASSCTGHELQTISLIFGWSFDELQTTAYRHRCEVLLATGCAEEATQMLLKILEKFGEERRADKATPEWVADLQKKCVSLLEVLGDAALSSGEHYEAIARYSSALSLNPSNPIDLLVKRSKARALQGLWEDALVDANEVIKLDPSSHQGYERKYVALHGAEDYSEAVNAVLRMLSSIENSPDEEIRRLQKNYTAPRETIATIDRAIYNTFKLCPLVLIDVTTGRLCDAQERIRILKSETPFKRLVSETAATKTDDMHILQVVAKYFEWIMFSHTWEGKEPTFQDVNLVDSVWRLDESPLNEKLRQFCTTAREDGYRWVWSDTCCIDKTTSAVLSQSLISMYNWYKEAAATLVYLADVLSPSELGNLTDSRWMTRAWTVQELLASKVIRFYDREWKPYLNESCTNHKESSVIKEELALALGVATETITSFRPEHLGVRDKLRLASTRNAKEEEDIAYSLIGIFSSDIVPRYGLGNTALGHLLENIVAHSGDVTVIAWTGKSMSYNSALPASLSVYGQIPYSSPPLEASELDERVEQLRTQLRLEDVQALYRRVAQLPRATFSHRCLHLPCIVFSVTRIGIQESGGSQGNLYSTTVSLLGKVKFTTMDVMPLKKPRNLVFVHPWLRDLSDSLDGSAWDDELEDESDATDDEPDPSESAAGSGDGTDYISTPTSPLHAEPSAWVDLYTRALRLIARLERPFNALLLERQPSGQYKRVAAEHEIIVPGVSCQTNYPRNIRMKAQVLEII